MPQFNSYIVIQLNTYTVLLWLRILPMTLNDLEHLILFSSLFACK